MHNFVSADAEEFRDGFRIRFARAYDRFTSPSTTAAEQFALLAFAGTSAAECIAIAYWSQCVRGCQAAFPLAERGMVADAQSSLRIAVETLFHAIALVRKPEILARLREHDDIEKRKQVKQIFKHKDIGATLTDEDRERLRPLSELPGELRSPHGRRLMQRAWVIFTRRSTGRCRRTRNTVR